MSRDLRGLTVCIGVDPTAATAVEMQKQLRGESPQSGGGVSMTWSQIAGLAVAAVALVVFAPKIIKYVG